MDDFDEKQGNERRDFLKTALVTAGSIAGFLTVFKFDYSEGVKVAKSKMALGMSEAHAACSYGSDCAGGGGSCSYGSSCGGGGGTCSYGSSCGGGGGTCSYGSSCAGG